MYPKFGSLTSFSNVRKFSFRLFGSVKNIEDRNP